MQTKKGDIHIQDRGGLMYLIGSELWCLVAVR